MGGIWNFQSNMNRGELDPLLVGRIDIQAYYNGLKTAANVLTLPQGGIKRRPGQDYLGTALGVGRMENFSFNIEQSYLLVFSSLKMQIYKDGVLQTNINGSGDDFLVTPWSITQVQEFDFIQSADTAIITHEDKEPRTITRSSDTDWSIDLAPLVNIPQFDFNDASSPTPIAEAQTITFSNATEGDRYKISLEGILSEEVIFGGDDSTNENAIKEALQAMPNTGNTGVNVITITPGFNYRAFLSGESADSWELITITPIFTANASFSVATSRTTAGSPSKEDVWSATRGWPKKCTFHEGRLYFGGSKSRLATIWGSNVNDFFNFDVARARDDEAVIATLDTDQVNAIEAIFSNRSLQIFTSGAEFYVKASPVTPSNIAVLPQTNLGAKGVRPISIDGVTLFVQRTGKALNQFAFVNEFQSNQTASVSSLAPHLIKSPIKMAASRGTESTDANYVYILNDDGSMTVFNTLSAEGIQAFTSWSSGEITSIAVVADRLYLLIRRVIDGSAVYHVEVESETALTDSSTTKDISGSTTITGLSYLEGESVEVKADGAYRGEFVVSSGEIELEAPADLVEVGLEYTPTVKTMPLNISLQKGPIAASKKRILRSAIQFYESNGIIVNGQRLPDKTIGVNQFDSPEPQTGLKRITLHGWSLEADITITQDTPMPMTILSIGMEVKS